jgi:tetratricopeptide (TPR) repeat protein
LPSRQHVSQCAHTISAVLHGLLGDVHRDRADWRVAIDEYRLAVAVDPARSDWLTREGWCEVAAGRITYALAIFERLAHEWSDDSTGDGGKGRCLLDLGDVEGAVASLSRAVAKNESWVYWRALANLARSAHAEFDDDLRRDEACAPDPLSDAVRHFWRAVAHDVAGRTEEVRAHLEASRSRMDALAPVPRQKLSGLIAAYDGNAAEARVGLEACFAVPEERGHSAYRSYLRLLTRILPQRPDLEETRAWFESRCPHLEESS